MRSTILCLAVLGGVVFGGTAAHPQEFPGDPAEVQAFLDGIIQPAMVKDDIAGVTVAVVKDRDLFLSKGYGYADVEARTPVDPAKTMFRVGSISKLFTWLMVMDQVSAGKLTMDTDVNDFLTTFKVPEAFGEPIRIRDLMTHAPGFEDHVIGLFARSADKLRPLDEILADELPHRMWAPGKIPSYSNHGTALAALVASNASGVTWEDFAENDVMRPIGMQYATPLQPVPENLAPYMAKGYRFENGAYVDKGFEFVPLAPAGAVSASAEDMAKFMLMMLNGGEWNGHRVIPADTLATMKEQLFTLDPRITGMAHGLIEMKIGNLRLVGHGGDTFWFHSILALDDTHHLGLFLSSNSAEGGALPLLTALAFFAHYFPPGPPEPVTMADSAAQRAQQYAGIYGINRHDYTGPAKIGALMNTTTVRAADDGALIFPVFIGTKPVRWLELEPGVYRNEYGHETVVFKHSDAIDADYFTVPNLSVFVFERLHGLDNPQIALAILIPCLGIFLIAPVVWVWNAVSRMRHNLVTGRFRGFARVSKLVAAFMCLWILGTIGMSTRMGDPLDIVFGLPPAFVRIVQMNVVAGALAALVTLLALIAWGRRSWGFAGRLGYTIVAAAGLAYFYWMYYWNFTAL